MTTEQALTAIGLIGIGGLLKSGVDYIIGIRRTKADAKHTLKEKRYKVIILLSYAYVNYEIEQVTLLISRPDIPSREKLYNELSVEWVNMALYASDNVVTKMKDFLMRKDHSAYNELIIEMRKDLYSIRTELTARDYSLTK